MADKLNKPPLIEAICEFTFESDNWDWTVPGLIYEKVKGQFPIRQQTRLPAKAVEIIEEEEGTSIMSGRVRFLSENKKSSIVVGPDYLAVGYRRPYPGWQVFKPQILAMLEYYGEAAEPETLIDIKLRYINGVIMPPGKFHFEDYFNIYPQMPRMREITCQDWFQRVELIQEEIGSLLLVRTGTKKVQTSSEYLRDMVTLDFSISPSEGTEIEVEPWLESAHNAIEQLFIDSFTKNGWALLKPEGNDESSNS